MILLDILSPVLALSASLLCPVLSDSQCAYLSGPLPHAIIEQDQSESFRKPRVALPHENPTKSFWTHGSVDANPLAKEGGEGTLTADADIVIIGSGITGVGTAYHLSEAVAAAGLRLNVVILEARDFCSGATGRNGGHLTANVFNGFRSITKKYNTDEAFRWLAIEKHTVNALLSILNSSREEVDLVPGQHVDILFSDAALAEFRADWQAAKNAGADVRHAHFFSKEETQPIYGLVYPSVAIPGHNLWPLKAVTHIFRLAQSMSIYFLLHSCFKDNPTENFSKSNGSNLHIHTHTPVTSVTQLEPNPTSSTELPRRWLLNTPRGSVRAHTVIHATNGYAGRLLPFLAADSERSGIIPTRGQVVAIRSSVPADRLRTASYSANFDHEYWFPRPVNETEAEGPKTPLIILGGGRDVGSPDVGQWVTDDSVLNPAISKTLREFLPSIYPDGWFKRGRKPEMEWTGIMGFSRSGAPLVGPVVDSMNGVILEGQYIAAGYGGNGMPKAFGCAEALVQMITSSLRNETWKAPDWFPNHFLTT